MYKTIDNTLVISVNDWCKSGLTYAQFNHDSKDGYLSIFRRGVKGNTLIDVRSIKRPDRLRVLEAAYGKIEKEEPVGIFVVELDTKARDFFVKYRKPDGSSLSPEQITKYTNKASIFVAIKRGLEIQKNARAKTGKRIKMGQFWNLALEWYNNQLSEYPCDGYSNVRSFERAFKEYLKDEYISIVHKNLGNDAARLVSVKMEKLFISLYRNCNKPFVSDVYHMYLEFVNGERDFFDKKTGEVYCPEDFRYKGRAIEVSEGTIWNYLKDIINYTSIYADRNGSFDYTNKLRPKHKRKLGQYSLSKITMDDVALSRKSIRGWVYKYIAVDVVSGYIFRPAYVIGKPTINTIVETFRNVFCELNEMHLPMPGELEVENHLMKDIPFLGELFPFLRFCTSATEKRAEHTNKRFKYGISKRMGHTRGRWYAKHEAYRSVRNKVNGDYIEPEYQPQAIIADDLADIEKYNNELHPLKKTYPGMTRKDVFLSQYNPDLKPIENWYLYKYIGNKTDSTIYNNDYCIVQGEEFELCNFNILKRLKSNNYSITAYWLPEMDGSISKVYLYQNDVYIGEAINNSQFKYNENKIEQTNEDRVNILYQNKRIAKFDKLIRNQRNELMPVGTMDSETTTVLADITLDVVETAQPKRYEEDEFTDLEHIDWTARAISNL